MEAEMALRGRPPVEEPRRWEAEEKEEPPPGKGAAGVMEVKTHSSSSRPLLKTSRVWLKVPRPGLGVGLMPEAVEGTFMAGRVRGIGEGDWWGARWVEAMELLREERLLDLELRVLRSLPGLAPNGGGMGGRVRSSGKSVSRT